MAGHSKWDNIKRKKQKEDARRGKMFTKVSRQIIIAARQGGGDPAHNFRLRLAIEKAKAVNMPNDTIERAIKRGTGGLEADNFAELAYEGYGPGGVALLVHIATDNRNRTAGDLRHIFAKNGGTLGESGCVAWMFDQRGLITLARASVADVDELMLIAIEAGAEDVTTNDEEVRIITTPQDFEAVKVALEDAGYTLESAEVTMVAQTTVSVGGAEAKQLMKLLDALEDHEDVQDVYGNFELTEEALAAMEA